MIRFLLPLTVAAIALSAAPAQAENYGLSMVGAPKYSHEQTPAIVNAEAPVGGTLKQAVIGTFDTVNPYALKGTAAAGLNLVYDRLMGRHWDEPFTLYPLIAKGYEIGEKREWISFTIDPRARFQDGTPITIADVRFSFETLRDKGRPNMRRVYELVEKISTPAPDTIRFDLKPLHDRETVMILAMMPVLSKSFWENRDFEASIQTPINSNGAYRIEKIDQGRQIILRRDPNYWAKDLLINRGSGKFERLVFDYYRDEGIALEAFLSGNLDIRRENNPSIWRQAYPKSRNYTQNNIEHGRAEPVWSIIFNTRNEMFADIRVRKALSLIFDAGRSNSTLFHSAYKRLNSYFPNTDLAADAALTDEQKALLTPYLASLPADIFAQATAFTLDDSAKQLRARQIEADSLLREAGWEIKNGERTNKNGEKLRIEIIVSNLNDERIALVWSRALKRLGINLTIRSLDATSFRNRIMNYDYQTVIHLWQSSLSPGAEQLLYWGCAAKDQPGRFNYAGICNPAIDDLAARLSNAQTREELQLYARTLDHILQHSHIAIPLYYSGVDRWALRNHIKMPDKTPLYGAMWENWWYQKD